MIFILNTCHDQYLRPQTECWHPLVALEQGFGQFSPSLKKIPEVTCGIIKAYTRGLANFLSKRVYLLFFIIGPFQPQFKIIVTQGGGPPHTQF